jgi:hypothetical protein
MKKTTYSYIAGIFDGEGHFTIGKTSQPESNGYHYTAQMGITNSHLPLMKYLVKVLGGVYFVSHRRKNQKVVYRWQPQANATREKALLAVLPYLREKRSQALLLLKFVRLHGQNVPDERETLYQEMQSLHSFESVETNMSGKLPYCKVNPYPKTFSENLKIESDLQGDLQSEPVVTQNS